jgi:hypothetical protein
MQLLRSYGTQVRYKMTVAKAYGVKGTGYTRDFADKSIEWLGHKQMQISGSRSVASFCVHKDQ